MDTKQALLCTTCLPSCVFPHWLLVIQWASVLILDQSCHSLFIQISLCLTVLCPFKAGARNLALFLSYWVFHFSFRNMLPKTACFGLWPGNCLITEGIWASVTEGRIGSIMFSSKFRERKWDLNTTGYCPALILKDLNSETTNKSCLLVARLQDCFLAHLVEALPSFFRHSPQVF